MIRQQVHAVVANLPRRIGLYRLPRTAGKLAPEGIEQKRQLNIEPPILQFAQLVAGFPGRPVIEVAHNKKRLLCRSIGRHPIYIYAVLLFAGRILPALDGNGHGNGPTGHYQHALIAQQPVGIALYRGKGASGKLIKNGIGQIIKGNHPLSFPIGA